MQTVVIVALVGLGLAAFGSILLAVSLNSLLKALMLAATAHDLTLQQIAESHSDVPVFTGLDTHVKRGEAVTRHRTVLGILLIGAGAVLQAVAVLLSIQT